MKIFISHAGNEGLKYGIMLNEVLKSKHETFFFEDDVTLEEEMFIKINLALAKSRIIAIIVTESSKDAKYQQQEFGTACSFGTYSGIIKENVDWSKFSILASKQYILFNDENAKEKMKEFLEKINKLPHDDKISIKKESEEILE